MSENEAAALFKKIGEGIIEAQRRLFERKAKFGESVIVADTQGLPCEISAEEALRRMNGSGEDRKHQADK